jgi:hypothetical protein
MPGSGKCSGRQVAFNAAEAPILGVVQLRTTFERQQGTTAASLQDRDPKRTGLESMRDVMNKQQLLRGRCRGRYEPPIVGQVGPFALITRPDLPHLAGLGGNTLVQPLPCHPLPTSVSPCILLLAMGSAHHDR